MGCWHAIARLSVQYQGNSHMAKLLEDLFLDTLKDVYFAEQKIVDTLPEMAAAATNTQLKSAFRKHLD